MSTRTSQKGFTLIEMVVTVFVYVVLIIGTITLIKTMLANSVQQVLAGSAVDQAQTVSTAFTNELRDANTGNDGSFPLYEAAANEIIFFTSYGTAASTTVNRIRYFTSGTTLYKGVIAPTGSPAVYSLANEVTSPVALNVMNSTTTVFTYYDGSYAGTSTPLTQPVNVNQVRFAQITLTPQMQDARGVAATYTIQTGVAIRNLKTNLGN